LLILGTDFDEIFDRLSRGIQAIEVSLKEIANKEFMHTDHLGFVVNDVFDVIDVSDVFDVIDVFDCV